jgi:hypothetical protein
VLPLLRKASVLGDLESILGISGIGMKTSLLRLGRVLRGGWCQIYYLSVALVVVVVKVAVAGVELKVMAHSTQQNGIDSKR